METKSTTLGDFSTTVLTRTAKDCPVPGIKARKARRRAVPDRPSGGRFCNACKQNNRSM